MNPRPPIVAIVGHIDHGKSTLLDYIRRTNVVESEAGGITQHLSAYEAEHPSKDRAGHVAMKKITFLDTPGHEAFKAMRSRGLEVADVAILVVSAEEGVKPQTLEALKLIVEVKLPYIVALTKIDKPGANLEKAKMSLLEHGVYLEGMGGDVPYVAVSGKTGEGIPELLDLILLAGELEGLSADVDASAEGLVIEAHVDQKRGNTATLIVQNGTIESGEFVVSGEAYAPVRIMENFLGKKIKEALPGSPVVIVGFSTLPTVGDKWHVTESKREAEVDVEEFRSRASLLGRSGPLGQVLPSLQGTTPSASGAEANEEEKVHVVLPLIIKTDVAGSIEAVLHEMNKLPVDERLEVKIVSRGVGSISESDVRTVGGGEKPGIIVGFNVKVEREARDLAERLGVEIGVFDIIYKLAEWLASAIEKHRPREKQEEQTGAARIAKVFSFAKGRVVLGGKVEEGALSQGDWVKVLRRQPALKGDLEIARGEIVSLQTQKSATKVVEIGLEFGAMLKLPVEPAAGDRLEAFRVVIK